MIEQRGRVLVAAAGAAAALGGAAWVASRANRGTTVPLPISLEGGRESTVKSLDGTEIHVSEFGPEDGQPLVLVHAWMCSMELWHRQIRELSGEARIIAMDLRGHGGSGLAPTLDYSIEAFADDLQAVLETTLASGQKAVMAGHSMGAMTIAGWAHRYAEEVPKRCSALAMIGTGLGDLTSEALVLGGIDGFRDVAGTALLSTEIPFDGAPQAIVERATKFVALGPDAREEDVALVAAMARNCPRRVRGLSGGTLSKMDVYDGLENLDVPAAVIAGEKDKMTPPLHSHKLAEGLPANPEVIIAPGSGHMVPLEADGVVTAELRALLSEAGRKGGRKRLSTSAP